jgi:hypothetical protein
MFLFFFLSFVYYCLLFVYFCFFLLTFICSVLNGLFIVSFFSSANSLAVCHFLFLLLLAGVAALGGAAVVGECFSAALALVLNYLARRVVGVVDNLGVRH